MRILAYYAQQLLIYGKQSKRNSFQHHRNSLITSQWKILVRLC